MNLTGDSRESGGENFQTSNLKLQAPKEFKASKNGIVPRNMQNTRKTQICRILTLLLFAGTLSAATTTINVNATKTGPQINPRMYGIFLEEINTGVDGGLYAELIRNRGFEDAKAPEGFVFHNGQWDNGRGYVIPYHFDVDKSLPFWSLVKEGDAQGSMLLDTNAPLNPATPRSYRLTIENVSSGPI